MTKDAASADVCLWLTLPVAVVLSIPRRACGFILSQDASARSLAQQFLEIL